MRKPVATKDKKSLPRYGVGQKGGRRPAKFRTSKRELEPILRFFYERGIGAQIIGRVLGYSYTQIWNYGKDMGLKPVQVTDRAAWAESLLPDDLKAVVRRIQIKNQVAHESARNRIAGAACRIQYQGFDEDQASCVNDGGEVRPKEAA
jgi:hypothetical protein